jgi:hypothetical protein
MKLKIAALLVLFTSPAFAVDLTVDQTAQILMPNGKPKMACDVVSDDNPPKCTHQVPATVGSTIQEACIAALTDASGRGSDAGNAKAGNLAIRFYGQSSISPTHEESTLILSRVDRIEDPVTIARMHEFLEPAAKDAPK